MTEKLQKILSRAGIASRRALEQIISEGRVTVNGKLASIGERYDEREITVKIDSKVVFTPESVTNASVPASPVVVVPIARVSAVPSTPVGPVGPVAPVGPVGKRKKWHKKMTY